MSRKEMRRKESQSWHCKRGRQRRRRKEMKHQVPRARPEQEREWPGQHRSSYHWEMRQKETRRQSLSLSRKRHHRKRERQFRRAKKPSRLRREFLERERQFQQARQQSRFRRAWEQSLFQRAKRQNQ
jgi:hypothetical protein